MTEETYVSRPRAVGPPGKLKDGTRFPSWADIEFWIDGWWTEPGPDAARGRMRLEIEGGRPVISAVCLARMPGGAPIDARTLRFVPLSRIADDARRYLAITALVLAPESSSPGALVETMSAAGHDGVVAGRRRNLTAELLAEVAEVYLDPENDAPTQAVANHFHISHRNATRWVFLARQRGLLPPYRKEK